MKRSKFIWSKCINLPYKDTIYSDDINIPNFATSGYGDRILGLFFMAILSKIKKKNINIKWVDYKKPLQHSEYIKDWRYKDTILKNFLSFFKLPSIISLNYELDPEKEVFRLNKYDTMGGSLSPFLAYTKYKLDEVISYDEYTNIVKSVKSEFGFNVSKFSCNEPYVTIHLRRTDKLYLDDEFPIDCSELELNNETKRAIQKAIDKGYTTFFLSSDEPSTKQEFIDFIISNNGKIIKPINIHNLIESYYDTWVMSSSTIIIPSVKYSSFSVFPCLLFDIEMWTVFEPCDYKQFGFCEHVKIVNYKNV